MNWETAHKKIRETISTLFPDQSFLEIGAAKYRSMPDFEEVSYGIKVKVGDYHFYIQWKSTSSSAAILHAIRFLKTDYEGNIPVVAVPFMGPTGKRLCEEEQVNWMDLSGNAYIKNASPPLLIDRSGKPNKFIQRGRKSSIFAPKSSRVVRWILLNPQRGFTNKLLEHETGVDAGYISRIMDRLLKSMYVVRESDGNYS